MDSANGPAGKSLAYRAAVMASRLGARRIARELTASGSAGTLTCYAVSFHALTIPQRLIFLTSNLQSAVIDIIDICRRNIPQIGCASLGDAGERSRGFPLAIGKYLMSPTHRRLAMLNVLTAHRCYCLLNPLIDAKRKRYLLQQSARVEELELRGGRRRPWVTISR